MFTESWSRDQITQSAYLWLRCPTQPNWCIKPQAVCVTRSTNQNALFVACFSPLERAVVRVVYGENFALLQAWIGNLDTIPPWIGVWTLNFDSSYVTFKYFAFLSICDQFELLGHVQAATTMWVLLSPFEMDSLLVTVSGFIGFFWSSRSSTILLCKFWGLTGSTADIFPFMRRWKSFGLKWSSHPMQVAQLSENGLRKHAETETESE